MMPYYRIIPRSIDDRDYWQAAADEPVCAAMLDRLKASPLPPHPTMPQATDILAARRSNDRARTDRLWQNGRQNLTALALRRCVEGKGVRMVFRNRPEGCFAKTIVTPFPPDDQLLDWLWAFLTQATWAVSAHLPERDLPASRTPTLDLAACEMAAFLAELREVTRPWMDSVSATLADSVLVEIDRRVLQPYGDGMEQRWDGTDDPDKVLNNWIGVCAGSILCACESLAAQGEPRPAARQRALDGLRLFFDRGFTEHGECDEGLSYWTYGMGVATLGLSRLSYEELSREMDLDRLREVAEYPRKIHLSGDVFYSGNDAGLRGAALSYFVPWLAAATGSEWLEQWHRRSPGSLIRHFGMIIRLIERHRQAGDISTTDTAPDSDSAETPATRFLADQQVAILRADTPAGALHVCLAGGHNGQRHNHNDVGHFIVTLDDRIIVPDLGAPFYTADFFGPRRYTYVSASSRGHSCPLVGGYEQRTGREAAGKVLEWKADSGGARLELDLTAAYPPEAGLERWVRTLERRGEEMVITDQYRTREAGVKIGHVIWSLEALDEGRSRLGPLMCEVMPEAKGVAVEEMDPASLRLRDYGGRTLYRIEWEFETDEKGELRVETRFGAG